MSWAYVKPEVAVCVPAAIAAEGGSMENEFRMLPLELLSESKLNPRRHFDKDKLNYSEEAILWKGIPGQYKSHVWHDRLTPDDVIRGRQYVEDSFRKAAGLVPLVTDGG